MSALLNGLAVLELFERPGQTVTVAEIARRLDVHKSTASRIAATLVAAGYLLPTTRGNGFRLGAKLTRLGQAVGQDLNLADIAAPQLRALADELGETCHLGVLDGTDAVTVAFADGTHSMRMHTAVGKRSPAYCTAMGKSMLAYHPPAFVDALFPDDELVRATPRSIGSKSELLAALITVRADGFALDDEELEIGLRCVSAPVRDHSGAVVGSVTLACSASRVSLSSARRYSRKVIDCASAISAALGAPGERDPLGPDPDDPTAELAPL